MSDGCTNIAQKPISIGPVELRNRVFLAPMSGITDVPFRKLAWEFGAGMVVSEMVASEALTTGQEEMALKAQAAGLPVHMVQLAGREARWMAEAAKMAHANGASIIDINMGCPSKRVTNGYSGSALMRDLDHAATLIDAVMGATDLPVTLKMRLGWDASSINAPDLAERAARAGVQVITVHGRTRDQFYKGQADWSKVAAVRERISVPLIVNGDIGSAADASAAMAASGADAVMVGRASYGAPWLPGAIGAQLEGGVPANSPFDGDFAGFVARHYQAILSFYGVELGSRNARKHLDWYTGHLPDAVRTSATFQRDRKVMMTSKNPREVLELVSRLFEIAGAKAEAA